MNTEKLSTMVSGLMKSGKMTQSNKGYHTRVVDVFVPEVKDKDGKVVIESRWTTAKIGGTIALMSRHDLIMVDMWPTTNDRGRQAKFNAGRYASVAKYLYTKGYEAMVWKDVGLKSEDGSRRYLPFVKKGTGILKVLRDMFDCKLPEAIYKKVPVKLAKYNCQPVNFDRVAWKTVLVIDSKDWAGPDGCCYSTDEILPKTGNVIKFVGPAVGSTTGAEGKGTIIHKIKLEDYMSPAVLELVRKIAKGRKYDIVATTDTIKFSTPGEIYDMLVMWHDDSSENNDNDYTVRLPEQLLRNAPLTAEFKARLVKMLDDRLIETTQALFGPNRPKTVAEWVSQFAGERDLDPEDQDSARIMGDVSHLVIDTGLPIAFHRVMDNFRLGLSSYMKNRTIGGFLIPGRCGFVVYNENLAEYEIKIPKAMANRLRIKRGDIVTTWKPPSCQTTIINRTVVGIVDDNHFEVKAHRGFDFDGDKLNVTPIKMIRFNANPEHNKADWDNAVAYVSDTIDDFSDQIVPANNALNRVIQEFEGLEQASMVGLFESTRAGRDIRLGGHDWEISANLFEQIIEGVLISGMKHGNPIKLKIWSKKDSNGSITELGLWDFLRGCGEYGAPNFYRLITSRSLNADGRSKAKADPQFELCTHDLLPQYRIAFDIACEIMTGMQVLDEDRAHLERMRHGLKAVVARIIRDADPETRKLIIRDVIDLQMKVHGWTLDLHHENGKFFSEVLKKSFPADQPAVKKAFREAEKATIDAFVGGNSLIAEAMVAVTLDLGKYAWIYYWETDMIKKIIDEAMTATEPQPVGGPKNESVQPIIVHTDGSSRGNPGPAAVGIVLSMGKHLKEIKKVIGNTTNNVAELMAIKIALGHIRMPNVPVIVHTDSEYAAGVLSGKSQARANKDLIAEIRHQMAKFADIRIQVIPREQNSRADALANEAQDER